jgi:DNA-binding NarL/FixJ family response regulator
MQQLVESDARVVVLDLRHTSSAQIASTMRLLRLAVNKLRLVAVTDPSDDASAQACVASGALAHLGQGQNPLSLLRAVNSAQRGAPCMGETGQRAVRRLRRDDE